MKLFAILFYIVSTVFIGIGFYKIFGYSNSEYISSQVNVYVGGDAYNYIINANYATAYFVLALLFAVIASSFLIIERLYLSNRNISELLKTIKANQNNIQTILQNK